MRNEDSIPHQTQTPGPSAANSQPADLLARIEAAAERYIRRRDRREHPDGKFDNARRWYPAASEKYAGCHRRPSRAWPYPLMLACRTLAHCANMHDVEDHLTQVRKRVRELDKANKHAGQHKGVAA